jgi:hypothetical protein
VNGQSGDTLTGNVERGLTSTVLVILFEKESEPRFIGDYSTADLFLGQITDPGAG